MQRPRSRYGQETALQVDSDTITSGRGVMKRSMPKERNKFVKSTGQGKAGGQSSIACDVTTPVIGMMVSNNFA